MFWLYWWKKGASNVIFVHVRFRYCMKSIMLTLRPSYRSMEFSFNFFKEQNDSSTSSAAISQTAPSSSNPYLQLPPIQPSDAHKLVSDARSTNQVEQIDIPETPLSFQLRKVVRNSSDTSAVQIAYFKTSVTPGVYEGGFKVWECAIDLIQYLHLTSKGELWTNATVIEAGCGVGLPAIYTLQQQAQLVYFQDLNVEVLEQSTKAAVALNAKNEQELEEWCNGKYSKRRRSNVAVIIVGIVFLSAFLFYYLLSNHSFQTNPNSVTNCFKLILSQLQLTTTTLLLRRLLIFEQEKHTT